MHWNNSCYYGHFMWSSTNIFIVLLSSQLTPWIFLWAQYEVKDVFYLNLLLVFWLVLCTHFQSKPKLELSWNILHILILKAVIHCGDLGQPKIGIFSSHPAIADSCYYGNGPMHSVRDNASYFLLFIIIITNIYYYNYYTWRRQYSLNCHAFTLKI